MFSGIRTIECLANAERTPTLVEFEAVVLRDKVKDALVRMRYADYLTIRDRLKNLTDDYYAMGGEYTPAYKARERRLAKKVGDLAEQITIYSY